MLPFLGGRVGDVWGNPSSVHHVGRKARALLDDARDRAASFLGAKPSEIIFTCGGSESINLALFGTARLLKSRGNHLITSAVEHDAVLQSFDYLEKKEGFAISRLPVDSAGRVSPDDLKQAIRPDTILVSLMAANNEIGTLQPVAELGAICRERGIIFHSDAVQWFGKEPFESIGQFNADLISVCGHKFHGPKGAGLLYVRSPLLPDPILFGGGHENERRAGTENLAGIFGLVAAMEKFVNPPVFPPAKIKELAGGKTGGFTNFSIAATRPKMPARFSVPARRSFSCPPPNKIGSGSNGDLTYSKPAPFGPWNLCPQTEIKSALNCPILSNGSLPNH